jgi:hypothetical protein
MMKNMYPQACNVCDGHVSAGEGHLRKTASSGWSVTHDTCPHGPVQHGNAKAYTRRAVQIMNRTDATRDEITEGVAMLAELMRTGWAPRESCERVVLNARAIRDWDRLGVEMLLHVFTLEESVSS